jgi:hypothetical protein
VQAFKISPGGFLEEAEKGNTSEQDALDPRDLAVSPSKKRLYVASHGLNRIAAYEIDSATGGFVDDEPVSCAIGRGDAQYVALAVGPDPGSSVGGAFLYASSETSGRVDVYPLNADGDILEVETAADNTSITECLDEGKCLRPKVTTTVSSCKCPDDTPVATTTTTSTTLSGQGSTTTTLAPPADLAIRCAESSAKAGERPPPTQPASRRDGLGQPKAIILDGDMLYVEQRFRKKITAFKLSNGLFCDSDVQCPGFDPMGSDKCKRKQQKRINNGKMPRQCAADSTPESNQYEDIVKFRQSILGTQFFKNRVDSYRLKPDDPNGPFTKHHSESEVDVRITPVRATAVSVLAIRGECSDTDPARPCDCPADDKCGVLYVAAGSLDRVSAYALFANGKMGRTPFDMTDEQTGSFPNDVAVVVLPEGESCIE